METNYKDRLIQSLMDELERVRAERGALRGKLEQTEMDLEVTRQNLANSREDCNRLEDEVVDRRKDVEARDKIILELSRPSSCEGDLISRNALVERIELIDWYGTNCNGVLHDGAANEESAYVRYADVAAAVAAAGTVEAEPVVRAYWIEHDDELGLSVECSACRIETIGTTPRCPHCGAHMDGERKNDGKNK